MFNDLRWIVRTGTQWRMIPRDLPPWAAVYQQTQGWLKAGEFHTQIFDQYNRYEQQVADGLTQMVVSGTSTQKVGEVAQTLLGVAPSASAVSRLNRGLSEQFDDWRERVLPSHWRALSLDGIHFEVRHGDRVDSTIIFVALGVDLEGSKDILAIRACPEERKDG